MVNIQAQLDDIGQFNNSFNNTYMQKEKPIYKVELVSKAHPRRIQIEKFIQNSYAQHFNARLKNFFPLIIAVIRVRDDEIISALGLRYADSEKLFSECYLPQKIENEIINAEKCIARRDKIIELGNFVVRKRTDVKKVMPTIAQFIKSINVDWLIYTLTKPIKNYFSLFDIELCHLHDANKQAVNGAAKDWGNYYNFKPSVYYTSVKRNRDKI